MRTGPLLAARSRALIGVEFPMTLLAAADEVIEYCTGGLWHRKFAVMRRFREVIHEKRHVSDYIFIYHFCNRRK
jgi:hypothetical protein